jgi:hypothetical protein
MSLKKHAGAAMALVLLLGLGLVNPLAAQTDKFSLTGGLGTEVLPNASGVETTYQLLSLLPDFPIGPFGIGIDMGFHFELSQGGQFGFYPRALDFYDENAGLWENVDKWTSRLAYFRYGLRGDPLYVQAGVLPNVTLGNGFIVGGYSNAMLQPARKFSGLVFNMDGSLLQFPYVGIESFTDNISSFGLGGLRVYTRPFGLLTPDVTFIKDLAFGVAFAVDSNPGRYSAGTLAPVVVVGLDSSLPLLNTPVFAAQVTADVAMEGNHAGATLGVGGLAVSFVTWSLQARFLGDNFLPNYFDKTYDLYRDSKQKIYASAAVLVPGSVGWSASLGFDVLQKLVFSTQLSGPFVTGSDIYSQPRLATSLTLQNVDFLPLSIEAYYNKDGLTSFDALINPENAVIGAKVGYKIGNTTIGMVYNLAYQPETNDFKTTSRLETAIALF